MTFIPEYQEAYLLQTSESRATVEMEEPIDFYSYVDPHPGSWDKEPIERRYIAYKETPKGYWIIPSYDFRPNVVITDRKKWIRKQYPNDRTKRKLFAYMSKEDALYSYYRRKLRHLDHLERKHTQLKQIVRKIEEQQDFFGRQRPMITHLSEYLQDCANNELKPLKRKRPVKGFIEEDEFII